MRPAAPRLIVLGLSCVLFACVAKPRDAVETKKGALESPVVVSVVDTDGVAKSDLQVMSLTPGGASGGYVWNDEDGQATLNVEDPGAYDFYVQIGATRFYSGHDGECELPGCSAATITVTKPTLVTVVDSLGAPVTHGDVVTFDENGAEVVYEGVDEVTGVATVYVPTSGVHRFGMFVDGDWYYSGAPGSCVYATCRTATITVSSSGSPPSSSVMVTVVDTDGAPVSGLQVTSKTPGGATGGYVWNDEGGHAAVPVEDPGSYDFYVQRGATRFYSGYDGQCVLPGCSSTTITTTKPTLVTVEGPTGIPFTQGDVVTFDENGAEVVYEGLDLVTGVATVYVPTPGPHRFGIHVDGMWFYSGEPGSCVYPTCHAATIVVYPPVEVSVTDTDGAPKTNLDVSSLTAAGAPFSTRTTDANGVASFRLPADAYRFSVQPDHYKFYSGAEAHCSVPGCDSATITISKMVRVTVKNAAGAPVPDKEFVAIPTEGEVEASYVTNEYGFCDVTLPELAWRFKAACLGTPYYSGPEGHCTLPGCEAALITLGCGGSCVGQPDGTSCNDLDGCTTSDHCDDEVCVGTAVTCAASDQCHTAGTCDPATGVCSNPAKTDGTTCDDGNPATSSDQCTSGACAGSGSTPCAAPAACRLPGRRDPVTNVCSYPFAENGSSCDDGNSATHDDRCQSGACLGSIPCLYDYQDCDDGNPCTEYAYCYNGSCRPGPSRLCGTSAGGCGSYCDPSTGQCSTTAAPDGSFCNDGNSCSNGDSCTAGVCAGVGACTGQVSLSASEPETQHLVSLPVVLTADRTSAMPSQPINLTAQFTYQGLELRVFGNFDVKNDSPSAYVVPGYSLTAEYQSAVSLDWIPLASVSYDASGTPRAHGAPADVQWSYGEQPNGSAVDYAYSGFAGTSVGSGASARWWFYSRFVLDAGALAIVTDPAQSLGMRHVIRFDAASGLPAGGEVSGAITAPAAGTNFGLTNVQLSATFDNWTSVTLTPSQAATLALGQSITATGVISSVVSLPASNHSNYLGLLESYAGRTFSASARAQASSATFGNIDSGSNSVGIAAKVAVVKPAIVSGPATIPAGYPATFNATLENTGSAAASNVAVQYRKYSYPTFTTPSATVTAPTTLAVGQTQPATIVYGTSPAQATNLDSAIAVTWSDAAGNTYGPLQTSIWYNNLSAPLPLGSIELAGQASGPVPVDLVQPLTATVRSPLGALVPGVNVQLTITGANPQTLAATTDASGVAHFSYPGRYPGGDTIVASATITTAPAQSNQVAVFWSTPYATCTSPDTPLDVVIAIDTSNSMTGANLASAKAAARAFLDTMDLSRDQLGIVAFGWFARLDGGLTSNYAQVRASIDRVQAAPGNFGYNATNIGAGLSAALNELASARRRTTATPIIVFVSDGGNSDGNPEPALASLAASGIRTFAFALGADADFVMLNRIAKTKNDVFYVPGANELNWLYSALRADLCRNQLPLVRAGGDQGVYGVRLPESVTLHGEVHDDGPSSLTTGVWSVVSGPGTVTFLDASSPETTALFSEPGTYVLRLTGSDGVHTVTDDATITVDPEPSVAGGQLQVALGLAGPLSTGTSETFTATLTDAASQPISNYPVQMTVTGANPQTAVLITNAAGVVTFSYVGASVGTDALTAMALAPTPLVSSTATVDWVLPAGAQPVLTQGWMAAPVHQSKVEGQVPITVAAGLTLTTGTITYWPMSAPEQERTLATGVSGGPGATLATLDTTLLANGPWVVKLEATNSSGQSRISMVSVTVRGDYKPGRVVVEQTDMTIPLAGFPITVGRRYDSLEKDNVGDFGHGWSLALGHPRLEVDPAHNVTITMPDNRRVTFYFQATSITNNIVFAWLYGPGYVPEAGTYGTLTADGCPMMILNGGQLVCFLENSLQYVPTTYTYTDPYGRAFVMSSAGDLKSITDRQGNKLTFTPTGITSSTGVGVTFERVGGRITKITGPIVDALSNRQIVSYTYDSAGDLRTVTLTYTAAKFNFTYEDHLLLTTKDPENNVLRTSTYDSAGRLATDKDALNFVTSYAYDLTARKTTITNPDTGTVQQWFDARGLLLKEVDPLNRTTEHTYDDKRNEVTRKNALNEVTTFTYDDNGNLESSEKENGDTTSITYNQYSQPETSTDANGFTTTIEYDERGIPKKFSDEDGTLATFTSSERGLPTSVTDAAGKTAYMTYDDAGNLTGRTNRLGMKMTYEYDGIGRLIRVLDPRPALPGQKPETLYAYNLLGPRSAVTLPTGVFAMNTRSTTYDLALNVLKEGGNGGRDTDYTYDDMNRVKTLKYPGATTPRQYTRDFRGNVLTEKDEANRITTYEYDKAGQLKKTTYPDLNFTTRAYDDLGRLVTATDERNHSTTYEYEPGCDCADRVTKVTDPLNHSTVTTYDRMSRRTSVTDASNHTTTYEYDGRGHLTKTTYADTTTETDIYDPRGRRTSHTDQMGSVTEYGYDDEGQLTSVTDHLDHVTQYAYDIVGNLKSVTDANNHVTSYEYDFLNRKTKRTLPLGMSETFVYNLFNDLTSHKDFRGKTTTMTYDQQSRLKTKVPDPTLGEPTITFTYNPSGTRLSMVDGSGTTNYTLYDQRDRLRTKVTPAGTLNYTYDPAGNLATISSSNTNGTSVGYVWDAANQLVSVTDNRAGGVTTSAYTATGRPSTVNQPSGVGATYVYNSLDRVTSLAWKQGTDPAFASWSYGINSRGQRTSVTGVSGRHVAYGYDAVSRLESETVTADTGGVNGAVSYVLDPTGNRLSRTSSLAPIPSTTYSYNSNDQLASDGYDLNGNTTSADGHTYTYDFENRLKSKNGTAVTLVYDGDGNRAAKTTGGVTTKYLVDDLNPTGYLQVLEEVSGGTVQVAYTYGTMLVNQTRQPGPTGQASYYGYDAHGSISFLADAAGTVTDTYEYDSWGNIVTRVGITPNTRLYAGEEFDPDLGLINLRARYYEPGRGRFGTVDPFEPGITRSPLALNRYLFTNSDPVNRADPLGLFAGGESAGLVATGPTRVVIATAPAAGAGTVAAGAAGATSAVAVSTGIVLGQKVACTFQNAADEFAATWGEGVVRADPKCPLYRCVCQCTPIAHTPGYDNGSPEIPDDDEPGGPFVPGRPEIPPPPKKPVKGTALGDSVQTASVRCLVDVYSKFAFESWNLDGWYEPDDCAIQNCWPVP